MDALTVINRVLDTLRAQGVTVTRLENDSRRVRPGDVFLAYPGDAADGRRYIDQAVARGAVAVVYEAAGWDAASLTVPAVAVGELKRWCGALADAVYGAPTAKLALVGVTGTNGKTSCTQWIAQALHAAGQSCAVIGTLGDGFPGALTPSGFTTPEPAHLQEKLAGFVAAGARACAIEVSSIGLAEDRVAGCRFATAVFTNLTRDHLDYHGSMAAYAEEKAKLFRWPGLEAVVVNLDDPFGAQLLSVTDARERIAYSLTGARHPRATRLLCADDLAITPSGLHFTLSDGHQRASVASSLLGRYNAANLLAVAGALVSLALPLDVVAAQLARLTPPPGRLECLGGEARPLVVVDYAHTPDALDNALGALAEVAEARGGKLVCVFGCGGDRDGGKRPLMGEVAVRRADRVIVTSDNPRSEDPAAIIAAILAGAPGAEHELDRARAVERAIATADARDVVLLAGKGHENYQEVGGVRRPYSDVVQAKAALAAWSNQQ
ncbi:UDP-N-acetylmuramoylalanyl-D-glutamate-2,6-diami no-pimelate ligase [Oryzomicrobium terrae]|uniref:UDP-N-acetylmuramoyl-L-alanyl-D-glutamate--2,6-diaminopimelate ligase n=1 Tax=Oryzomicrobium terrae TaxID=1735038 RepID=A0A5C1ECW0_9RHOO|nr:UDP-N-acetylmuramoyl-L-alanyl-D-glutamate--2,6-diaminopimelate ligase [Oryzomicrobium terrae]QEL66007.1 UDP-N-acetylmuramoylalanyl-D-glutamate-2,6-diami no-pimelate ligase [Oryzomicrobium terrae]